MTSALSSTATCPECGAALGAGQGRCWLCQRKPSEQSAVNPYAPPQPIGGEHLALQFSLASLFLVMTLVAVSVGTLLVAPGLGVLLVVLGVPALARTIMATNRQKRVGRSSTIAEKIGIFLASLLVMTAVWISAAIAGGVVCTAGGVATQLIGADLNIVMGVGLGGGLISAIAMATWLLRLTAPTAHAPDRFRSGN